MIRAGTYLTSLALAFVPVNALGLENSIRPQMRPALTNNADVSGLRPQMRPTTFSGVEADAQQGASQIVDTGLRPKSRPEARGAGVQTAAVVTPGIRPLAREDIKAQPALFKKRKPKRGSVCGSRNIRGEKVGAVPGKLNGCGLKDAVRITEISDVKLSRASVMNCETAQALNRWVDNSVKKAFRSHGRVVELQVAAHYACRTRNNRPGAKISEHGRGRAIDISGFKLSNGDVISVYAGWRSKQTRRAMKWVHREACGPFGTVLGPNADRYHQDHFHFDTARHRGGPYCR